MADLKTTLAKTFELNHCFAYRRMLLMVIYAAYRLMKRTATNFFLLMSYRELCSGWRKPRTG